MVDCTGLENRQRATVREFESHRLRQPNKKAALTAAFLLGCFFIGLLLPGAFEIQAGRQMASGACPIELPAINQPSPPPAPGLDGKLSGFSLDGPRKKPTRNGWLFDMWWRGGGSNSRPPHCERGALPAELPPHALQGAIICALMRSCNKGSRAMQGEHWRTKYSSGGCC